MSPLLRATFVGVALTSQALIFAAVTGAQEAAVTTARRPAPPAASDPGPPPVEPLEFRCSPTQAESWDYLRKAEAACRTITVAACGYSTEGRPIPAAFVWERDGAGGAWEDERTRPVVLITAGIHSGEICGNDALQLLLRDIARGLEPEITAHLRLILVPILNVDGHARRSIHHRFTQVGPECGCGTRRSALNLDLNRDYMKLETPECQAVVQLASQYQPHVYIDLHTDDGIGHQYDILYSAAVNPTFPGDREALVRDRLAPAIEAGMAAAGFRSRMIAGPRDREDPAQGMSAYGSSPHLGTGYLETRQAISILSEAYPYVSYERRVRATAAFVREILHFAAANRLTLCNVVDEARATAQRWALEPGLHRVGLGCQPDDEHFSAVEWLGKSFRLRPSAVGGPDYALYSKIDTTYTIPLYDRQTSSVTAPMSRGYLFGPEWSQVARKLQDHCLAVERLTEPWETEVEGFHIQEHAFSAEPYQGHHPLEVSGAWHVDRRTLPAGSYWVPLDQPGGLTAMHLLEPEFKNGLLAWNAFDTIFERGIILETWALEELARRMLADPRRRAEYDAALADSTLGDDHRSRLLWLFDRSEWGAEPRVLYPVFRASSVPPAHRGL